MLKIFSENTKENIYRLTITQIVEGCWNYTRTVLIRFNNKNDFDEWYNSKDYQDILKHRLKAADCDTILIKGLN